ncbi:hypothetical protein K9M47_04175 [Candidatus Gracilibacteria bacterium]|nr:hypothetical protein [Candidatus Gracilibacteria bacterium]MCF7898551.1 hypothetical protein [Candidatus Paceibacterota bacterium]
MLDLTLEVNERATALVAILQQQGAVAADKAVEVVADKEGDKSAAKLIGRLPAVVVADIVVQFDYTKPSIVGMIVTPKQLRKVVERLPLMDQENRISDVLCGVILHEDDTRKRKAFLSEFTRNEIGIGLLAIALEGDEFISFIKTGSFSSGEDAEKATSENIDFGGKQELAFALKEYSGVAAKKVASVMSQEGMQKHVIATIRSLFGNESGTNSDDNPYAKFL